MRKTKEKNTIGTSRGLFSHITSLIPAYLSILSLPPLYYSTNSHSFPPIATSAVGYNLQLNVSIPSLGYDSLHHTYLFPPIHLIYFGVPNIDQD